MEKLHYNEGDPRQAELGHRLEAQLEVARRLGIDENKFDKWAVDNAGIFAEIAANDPELDQRIRAGEMTDEDLVFITNMMGEYDLGEEDHTAGPDVDA